MARKIQTVAAVELTPELRAAAHALMTREKIASSADRAHQRAAELAGAARDYAGATASVALVGIGCTGTFLKRLVFGAPKVKVPAHALSDAELRAVLARHGLV